MQRVVPSIRVRSCPESQLFYEALGFRLEWTHQFEANFPIVASVSMDGMRVFLTEHIGDCQFGALVHFYVPDVDALYASFQDAGVAVAEPPNNGLGADLRCMSLLDPDGNRLKFLTVDEAH